MLNKVKAWLEKKQEENKKRVELQKAKRYYSFIKAGAAFISFVQSDLKKVKEDMNRSARRRMQHDLNDKGVLSEEIVNYYQGKINYILTEVDKRLNPPKQPKVKSNPNCQVRSTPPNGYQPKPATETGKIIPPQGGTGETKRA